MRPSRGMAAQPFPASRPLQGEKKAGTNPGLSWSYVRCDAAGVRGRG